MTPPVKLALVGMGKMGRALAQLAPDRGCEVVATLDEGDAIDGSTLNGAEVAIEFTAPDAAVGNIRKLVQAGCPVVVGTTGWYDELPTITDLVSSKAGALVYAPNFSIGVNLFREIVVRAAAIMKGASGFDVHLVEVHHAAKKDAPSGTAASLSHAAAPALGREIPVTSVRVGAVPGTHELIFDAPFETIRLEHVARDRRVFADGAITAAKWLVGRRGVFQMQDVLAMPSANDQQAPRS